MAATQVDKAGCKVARGLAWQPTWRLRWLRPHGIRCDRRCDRQRVDGCELRHQGLGFRRPPDVRQNAATASRDGNNTVVGELFDDRQKKTMAGLRKAYEHVMLRKPWPLAGARRQHGEEQSMTRW
jgi:hypothetical protein